MAMEENKLFYYFGDDEAYFRTLIGEFKRHTRLSIKFERVFESEEKKIQSLFLKIIANKPLCVFIDFSKLSQDYLHLARILSRTPLENKPVTIGLVDYLSPPEILLESIATGVNLTHIKSAESFDVVFDVAKLVSPGDADEHGFATATLKEEWEGGIPVKVGYVHSEGLHFETDHQIQKGDRIRLNHHWSHKKIVPSKELFVQEISTMNLFYHFKYAVDAEFLFLDEFLPPEGLDSEAIETKKRERDELIVYHRKQLSRWIDDNLSSSLEKKAKVLVVDSKFHFYEDQQRTDKHSYTIRCVPYLEDVGVSIDRMMPQVIAFALDNEEEGNPKNTNEELVQLVEAVKVKMKENNPFIVIFNSKATSSELQESFNYSHLMATENDLCADVLVKMATIFEKKLLESQEKQKAKSKSEQKIFLRKTNLASISEILVPIRVVKLSETDMIFQTEHPLKIGMNLHLTKPVDMFINVQPTKTQGKVPEFLGLIHCLGEAQKKELRKYINSVFFREHDAKVTAEAEGFKKLNEDKLRQKEEAIKKAKEEAEAKAKAEAEEKEKARLEAEAKKAEALKEKEKLAEAAAKASEESKA
jgi:hypothetical protein